MMIATSGKKTPNLIPNRILDSLRISMRTDPDSRSSILIHNSYSALTSDINAGPDSRLSAHFHSQFVFRTHFGHQCRSRLPFKPSLFQLCFPHSLRTSMQVLTPVQTATLLHNSFSALASDINAGPDSRSNVLFYSQFVFRTHFGHQCRLRLPFKHPSLFPVRFLHSFRTSMQVPTRVQTSFFIHNSFSALISDINAGSDSRSNIHPYSQFVFCTHFRHQCRSRLPFKHPSLSTIRFPHPLRKSMQVLTFIQTFILILTSSSALVSDINAGPDSKWIYHRGSAWTPWRNTKHTTICWTTKSAFSCWCYRNTRNCFWEDSFGKSNQ